MYRWTSQTQDTPPYIRNRPSPEARLFVSRQVTDDIEWAVTWGIVTAMVIGMMVIWVVM